MSYNVKFWLVSCLGFTDKWKNRCGCQCWAFSKHTVQLHPKHVCSAVWKTNLGHPGRSHDQLFLLYGVSWFRHCLLGSTQDISFAAPPSIKSHHRMNQFCVPITEFIDWGTPWWKLLFIGVTAEGLLASPTQLGLRCSFCNTSFIG